MPLLVNEPTVAAFDTVSCPATVALLLARRLPEIVVEPVTERASPTKIDPVELNDVMLVGDWTASVP